MSEENIDDSKIAGKQRCSDWQKRKQELLANGSKERWLETYEDFFETRLETRYFKPIRKIAEDRELEGEGFSIMAILCTLVEFLEAIRQGKEFRQAHTNQLNDDEYNTSRLYFKNLLLNQQPFADYFDHDDNKAQDFYEGIRCGLLHEAQTKKRWKIRHCSSEEKAIDFEQRIVYWSNFHKLVEKYLVNYSSQLSTDSALQEAFIKKYDSLCRNEVEP